jgi:endonuclease/exonuclease/phosphatase family metal-dependent hydrolase
MKIYSWNVLRSNRKLPEVYEFIENLDFDVLCLQEVTEPMLVRFKSMPFHIAYHVDRFAEVIHLFSKNKIEVNYAVILSKHEIVSHEKIEFPKLLRTFNSNVFEFFMERLQKWESITNLGSVYADIKINGSIYRIFCTHLALWNPQTRAKEFGHLMEYLPEDSSRTIICGDFNILEWAPVKILNWFLGSSIHEAMPWYSERAIFEERFAQSKFKNPLKGKVTHPFSRSQLDHILLPESMHVTRAWVEVDSHGSDHQPIGVEIGN